MITFSDWLQKHTRLKSEITDTGQIATFARPTISSRNMRMYPEPITMDFITEKQKKKQKKNG